MSLNLAERNRCIVREFLQLKQSGFRSNKLHKQLGEKYFLSPERIRDIVCQRHKWPVKAVTICDRAGLLSESAVVDCIIRLPGRPPAILDRDIARFYGTKTQRINEQVKRNQRLFPTDFLFQPNDDEMEILLSQNAIPSKSYLGGHVPYAFTQYGCNMLSTVLKTEKARKRAIQIIRAFTAVEIMIHKGMQNQKREHPMSSKMLSEMYSSLWVLRQAMSATEGMRYYVSSLESIMQKAENIMDISIVVKQ